MTIQLRCKCLAVIVVVMCAVELTRVAGCDRCVSTATTAVMERLLASDLFDEGGESKDDDEPTTVTVTPYPSTCDKVPLPIVSIPTVTMPVTVPIKAGRGPKGLSLIKEPENETLNVETSLPLLVCAAITCQQPFRDPALSTGYHPVTLNCGCCLCGECAKTVTTSGINFCPVCHRYVTGGEVNHQLGVFAEEISKQRSVGARNGSIQMNCEDCYIVLGLEQPVAAVCTGGAKCRDRGLCEMDAEKHARLGHVVTMLHGRAQVACTRHPRSYLIHYCRSHDVSVCPECLDDHTPNGHPRATHDIVPIADATTEIETRLKESMLQCQVRIQECYVRAQTLEIELATAKAEYERFSRKVSTIESALCGAARQASNERLASAETSLCSQEKVLVAQIYSSGVCAGQLEAGYQLGAKALRIGEITGLLSAAKYIAKICVYADQAQRLFDVRGWTGDDIRCWARSLGLGSAGAHLISLIPAQTLLTMRKPEAFTARGIVEASSKVLANAVLQGNWPTKELLHKLAPDTEGSGFVGCNGGSGGSVDSGLVQRDTPTVNSNESTVLVRPGKTVTTPSASKSLALIVYPTKA